MIRALHREPGITPIPDLLACQDLVLGTYERIDAGRRSTVADVLTGDGSLAVGGDVVTGRDAVRAALAERDAVPGRRTCHAVTNLRLHATAEERVEARYTLLPLVLSGPTPVSPAMVARVDDVLVKQDGTWLLETRRIAALARGG